jgi:hypothetical protein
VSQEQYYYRVDKQLVDLVFVELPMLVVTAEVVIILSQQLELE